MSLRAVRFRAIMGGMGAHFEFDSVRELGQTIGIEPIDRGHVTGFPAESGWGIYRGEGFGHRGLTDGWLVAFAMAHSRPKLFSDSPSIEPGALIAHEIIGDHRTGRCLLLIATGHKFGPVLPEDKADELRTIAQRQPWFRDQAGGANVNIETELLPWL